MKLAITGSYRTKASINLFGWRITLWSRRGRFDEEFALARAVGASALPLPGPFDLVVRVTPEFLAGSLVVDGTSFEVFAKRFPIPDPLLTLPIRLAYAGNEIDAVVTLENRE